MPSSTTRFPRSVVHDPHPRRPTSARRRARSCVPFEITVTDVNDPPTAVDDSATVAENSAATPLAVLANDSDADGDPMTIASASDPANGTVVLTGGLPGAHTGLTYKPDPNYCSATPDTLHVHAQRRRHGHGLGHCHVRRGADRGQRHRDGGRGLGRGRDRRARQRHGHRRRGDDDRVGLRSGERHRGRSTGGGHRADLSAGRRTTAARRRTPSRTRSTAARRPPSRSP